MRNTVRKIHWLAIVAVIVGSTAAAENIANGDGEERVPRRASYDWSELIQPPLPGAEQQQRDQFASFTESLSNESFEEAEGIAKQMVEQVDAGSDSAAMARARSLHNLAIAQQFQGHHDSAIQNYKAALHLIGSSDDMLSESLVLPLRGLALAYVDTDRTFEAFDTFDRALHVSNVNYGPHSLNQLPILSSKMQAYLDNNDVGTALEVLDRISILYSRKYSWNSQEMLPAVYLQAEMYGQLGMLAEERMAWRHILAIKQEHHAEDDIELIEPNIKIAANFIRELRKVVYRSGTTPSAEKHLKKALWIAENSPDASWQSEIRCLLALADYYTLLNVGSQAHRYYAQAWNLLSSDDAYLPNRAASFALPVPLARPKPDPYANFEYNPDRDAFSQNDYLQGEMVMAYTVNDRGRTQDLRIVEASPPNFSHMERRVRNSVKEFVFRPRYAGGKAIEANDQRYRMKYYYRPAEYKASLEKSDKLARPTLP